MASYADNFKELRERLNSCLIELHDIADEVETAERRTEGDPARAEELQDRLNVLYTLQRKHQARDLQAPAWPCATRCARK